MPFDNIPVADAKAALYEEAAQLIEKGLQRIANPNSWTKHQLYAVYYVYPVRIALSVMLMADSIGMPVGTKMHAYCGVGSVLGADRGVDKATIAESIALAAMNQAAARRSYHSFSKFNDSTNTKHEQVIAAMKEAAACLRDGSFALRPVDHVNQIIKENHNAV
jgi:hypothetical protein